MIYDLRFTIFDFRFFSKCLFILLLNGFLKKILIGGILVLLIVINPQASKSQQAEIFGYFEPQLMGAKIGSEFYQLASNKLRIDLQAALSDNVSFGANFDFITYHGKTKWDVIQFLPESVQNEVPTFSFFGSEINPYILPFENRQFLYNAFVKLSFKYVDLTIGKQQLSMGTGYVWNPTDVFNKKDIIDPTYEQPGHNAARLDVPIKGNFSFTGIYSPTDNWKNTDLLFKLKGQLLHFDVSILAIQKQWKFTDARLFDLVEMNFYQLNTMRHIWGADFAGELLGLGVWGEFAKNIIKISNKNWTDYQIELNNLNYYGLSATPMDMKKDYYELVLGMDYTFDFQTYVMAEFYRNSFAKNDFHNYGLNDWFQLLLAETKTITQDQIYLLIKHPLSDLIDLYCSSIYSFSDESYALVPMLTYNVFENVDLTVIGNYYFGKEGTAYAKNLGNGGIIRLRTYF